MDFKAISLGGAIAVLSCAGPVAATAAPDAAGVWLNDSGRGAVEIKDCGGKLCGHVVWTRDETDASRGCGKQIIGEAAPSGSGLWDGGWIYSPDKKRRYDVELKPLNDGTLRVTGYAGTKLFSKTMIWTPAPADLKRCNATAVEAKAEPKSDTETAAIATPPPVPGTAAKPEPEVKTSAVPPPAASATQALAATETAKSSAPAAVNPKPAVKPEGKSAAGSDNKADPKPEPRVAQAEEPESGTEPEGNLMDKLDGMEFGDGYGVKKLGNGDCRVKLPYVTLTVPCKK